MNPMLELSFTPFPVLKTPRLLLRQVVPGDAARLLELRSSETVMRYIEKERMKSEEEALGLIQKITDDLHAGNGINWAITLLPEDTLIGTGAFWRIEKENYRAEIGYLLHPGFYRRGIMNEAIAEMIRFGFEEMKLHSIEANVNPENQGSVRLLERHGFVREGLLRDTVFFRGKFYDTATYSLLRT
jgi:ribosomal-protein-alanine N-acetyltransferase